MPARSARRPASPTATTATPAPSTAARPPAAAATCRGTTAATAPPPAAPRACARRASASRAGSCPDDGNACTEEVATRSPAPAPTRPRPTTRPATTATLCTQSRRVQVGRLHRHGAGGLPERATACRERRHLQPGDRPVPGRHAQARRHGLRRQQPVHQRRQVRRPASARASRWCAAGDQCHNAGTCDPTTGLCFNPNKANGTACNDGVNCTGPDICTDGTCGGDPVVCQASDGCHEAGVCEEATGVCTNPRLAQRQGLQRQQRLHPDRRLHPGVCQGSNPVTCPGETACRDALRPATRAPGMCVSGTPKPNGTTCSDSRQLHRRATPARPALAPARPWSAPPPTSATRRASARRRTGPVHATRPRPTARPATTESTAPLPTAAPPASAAAPRWSARPRPTPATCSGTCQEATGACTTPNAPDGTTCSDGKTCTTADRCTRGVCGGIRRGLPGPGGLPLAGHLPGADRRLHDAGCSRRHAPAATATPAPGWTAAERRLRGQQSGAVCQPGDQCLDAGVCNPSNGTCSARKPKPARHALQRRHPLHQQRRLLAGSCGGTPVTCSGEPGLPRVVGHLREPERLRSVRSSSTSSPALATRASVASTSPPGRRTLPCAWRCVTAC